MVNLKYIVRGYIFLSAWRYLPVLHVSVAGFIKSSSKIRPPLPYILLKIEFSSR